MLLMTRLVRSVASLGTGPDPRDPSGCATGMPQPVDGAYLNAGDEP